MSPTHRQFLAKDTFRPYWVNLDKFQYFAIRQFILYCRYKDIFILYNPINVKLHKFWVSSLYFNISNLLQNLIANINFAPNLLNARASLCHVVWNNLFQARHATRHSREKWEQRWISSPDVVLWLVCLYWCECHSSLGPWYQFSPLRPLILPSSSVFLGVGLI